MEKKKLIFVDTYNSGPDYLDPVFDPNKVELSEIFTFNGENGVNVSDVGEYEGWDYAVITYMPARLEQIKNLMVSLGIPTAKSLYISPEGIICDDIREFVPLFLPEYANYAIYNTKEREYESKKAGDYISVTVDGVSYVNRSSDNVIMKYMYIHKENFALEGIRAFASVTKSRFSFSEEQDIFCDIGANIGTTSIYFKKKIDPSVRILAFEPAWMNYKLLKINMILNDFDEEDFKLAKYAVSDERTISKFEYNLENPGGSSLMSEVAEDVKVEEVQVIPFDDYVDENQIDVDRIKYIWIDVEGFEPAFFKGARKTLEKINVPIITEFTPEFYRKTGRYGEFAELLGELYKTFIIIQEENPEKEHPISDLSLYENFDYQIDIMLFK